MLIREENGVKVILVDRLPPEVLAKVQALYARRSESMEVHLRDVYSQMRASLACILKQHDVAAPCAFDLMTWADADGSSAAKFMNEWYVGYNHASIGDCAVGAVLGVEGISELACKALQHWPLFSGQQTSTRAVDMSRARVIDPIGTSASRTILDRWMAFYTGSQEAVAEKIRQDHPRQEGESEKDYTSAVKMRTFDILRGFLPAGLTTQTSMAMNLRQLADELTWLLHHPLEEVRRVGRLLQSILQERYPASGSFGGSAALSGIGTKGVSFEEAEARDAWISQVAANYTYQRPDPEQRSESNRCTFYSNIDKSVAVMLPHYRNLVCSRPRGCVLPRFLDDLGTCTAGFLLDYGSWRDIERQRAGTCRVPMLTMEYGFEPWYLNQLPRAVQDKAAGLLCDQALAIEALTDDPLLRQYYIPFGYYVSTTLTYTLPIWAYVLELRTGPNVHPTLRKAMLDVVREFDIEFRDKVPLHVDRRPDPWSIRRGQQIIEKRTP